MIADDDPRVQSVCQVIVDGAPLGTGWVLDEVRVATAAHVVMGCLRTEATLLPVTLVFPSGEPVHIEAFELFDWVRDTAVLRVREGSWLPAPLRLASVQHALQHQSAWESWGFPLLVNARGFVLSGDVVGIIPIDNDARAIQLSLTQVRADVMGGASGAPIWVGDRCVGLVRQFPSNLPVGTVLASPLQDLAHCAPLQAAFDLSADELPPELEDLLGVQLSWVEHTHGLTLGKPTTAKSPFVNRTIITQDGQTGGLDGIAGMLGDVGTLIDGETGTGKSRLLTEWLRRLCTNHRAAGFSRRVVPLLMSASNAAHSKEFFESMASPHSCMDASQLRKQASNKSRQWIFLIDALDEVSSSGPARNRLEQFMFSLERFCIRYGHRWVATKRTNTDALTLPPATKVLHLCALSSDQAAELQRRFATGTEAADTHTRSNQPFPDAITRNPLLLNAALQLLVRRRDRRMETPAHVLLNFMQDLTQQCQEQFHQSKWAAPVFKEITLLDLASTVAQADNIDNAYTKVHELVATRCELGRSATNKAVDELFDAILPATGILKFEGDEVHWVHLLYRDTLMAYELVEAWRDTRLNELLDQRYYTAASLALVLLQDELDVEAVVETLSHEVCPKLLANYLLYGGKLDERYVEAFVAFLCDAVMATKHRHRSCSSLLSVSFSPLDTLLTVSHLPMARRCLEAVADDLFADAGLRSEIKARLITLETDLGA